LDNVVPFMFWLQRKYGVAAPAFKIEEPLRAGWGLRKRERADWKLQAYTTYDPPTIHLPPDSSLVTVAHEFCHYMLYLFKASKEKHDLEERIEEWAAGEVRDYLSSFGALTAT
jgi:hypothetical protein